MFCFVHGIFVFALLGGFLGAQGAPGGMGNPLSLMKNMASDVLSGGMLIAALALIGSHLYSYLFHFLLRGEYRRTNIGLLMAAPYGRIVVLHLAILFGAFATLVLGQPLILVLLLIGGKTLLDWQMHVRAHRTTSGEAGPAGDGEPLWADEPETQGS